MKYVVCSWFANGPYDDKSEKRTTGEGMLVAEIDGIRPSLEEQSARDRYIIRFGKWARLSHGILWSGDRNPVTYTSLTTLNIDPAALDWQEANPRYEIDPQNDVIAMDMRSAKIALSLYYNVPSTNIEITIRG